MNMLYFGWVKLFFIELSTFLPNFAVGNNTFFYEKGYTIISTADSQQCVVVFAKGRHHTDYGHRNKEAEYKR